MWCRATGAFQSVIIRTLWSDCQLCPGENESDVAHGHAHSALSCSPHSSVGLRGQTTRRRVTAQCLLRREILYLLASGMVWLRQAASELRRGLEPGDWRGGDWQPRPRTPTGDASCGGAMVVPLGWLLALFFSWPPHPCPEDSAPDPRTDWPAASDLYGGAKETIWWAQREIRYSRTRNSGF